MNATPLNTSACVPDRFVSALAAGKSGPFKARNARRSALTKMTGVCRGVKAFLLSLEDYAGGNLDCHVSLVTVAEELNSSAEKRDDRARLARRWRRRAEEAGLLVVQSRGPGETNRYAINYAKVAELSENSVKAAAAIDRGVEANGGVTDGPPKVAKPRGSRPPRGGVPPADSLRTKRLAAAAWKLVNGLPDLARKRLRIEANRLTFDAQRAEISITKWAPLRDPPDVLGAVMAARIERDPKHWRRAA